MTALARRLLKAPVGAPATMAASPLPACPPHVSSSTISGLRRPASPRWVLVVDDHPLTREGMQRYLAAALGLDAAVGAAGLDEIDLALGHHGRPQLVVLDYWLRGSQAADVVAHLRRWCAGVPVLVVSGDEREGLVAEVRRLGVQGFVCKAEDPAVLAEAARELLQGRECFRSSTHSAPHGAGQALPVTLAELGLTPQQGRVLQLLLAGQANKRIALALDIAESTVKEHVTAILRRLGVASRTEVIARLAGRRLVIPEGEDLP